MKFQSDSAMNLRRAILISLVLHVILLWQQPPAIPRSVTQSQGVSADSPLSASLRAVAALPAPATNAPDPAVVKTRTAAQPVRAAAAQPAPEQPQPQVNLAPASPQAAETGLDANGLRQYRLSLATAARRYKLYPPLALENGWSGTADVAVAVAANGLPQPPKLLRSSGYSLLDGAALEMMNQAAANTAVPSSLQGRDFSIRLPVEFARDER